MTNKVYIVTSPELGWDCIVGVYTNTTLEDLKVAYPGKAYVIQEHYVETFSIRQE